MIKKGGFHNINIFIMSIKSMFDIEKKLRIIKLKLTE